MNCRIIAAFLLAPLAPCLAQALLMKNAFAIIIYSVFAYPLGLGLGIPAYLVFRRLGWLSFPKVMFAGLFLGGVGAILIDYVFAGPGASYSIRLLAPTIVIFAADGAIAASVFWLVGLRGTPLTERPIR
ncbi:MAG: hypothetical protein ACLPXB_01925 [Thiobacillaceae bacterium]